MFSPVPLIRRLIAKAVIKVKKYADILIHIHLIEGQQLHQIINAKNITIKSIESDHAKANNSSKVGKICEGDLLSRLRLNTLSKLYVSNHLLKLHKNSIANYSMRQFTTTRETGSIQLSAAELKKSMEHLTDQFTEARELLNDARESMGTVYFSEDMDEAHTAVITTLEQYKSLLNKLSEDQKQEVLRTIGLKMEELKAQEQSIRDSLKD